MIIFKLLIWVISIIAVIAIIKLVRVLYAKVEIIEELEKQQDIREGNGSVNAEKADFSEVND